MAELDGIDITAPSVGSRPHRDCRRSRRRGGSAARAFGLAESAPELGGVALAGGHAVPWRDGSVVGCARHDGARAGRHLVTSPAGQARSFGAAERVAFDSA